MRYRILGPLEVLDGDRRVELPAAKHRALLALLLLSANEIVSLDRLIDELWESDPPKTAKHVVQVYVSQLRKALGSESIATRPPGYLLEIGPGQLDLHEFERLAEEGRLAVHDGRMDAAAELLARALAEWRGDPLADFVFEAFAQAPIARLGELRLAALEERIDADLRRGRHAELVGELTALVASHPLSERLRWQLMLALYRAGRQADALDAYQSARRALVEELGIDPSPSLQDLERAILQHDPSLDWVRTDTAPAGKPAQARHESSRSILVLVRAKGEVGGLAPLAETLAAASAPHEVIFVGLVGEDGDLAEVGAELQSERMALLERGVRARATAFTSSDEPADLMRFAAQQDADLVLLPHRASVPDEIDQALATVFERSPCDVAVRLGPRALAVGGDPRPVLVPFGGAEHDWAALELATWAAAASGVSVRMLGSRGTPLAGRRDASRLLASAALAVQQLAGVPTETVLAAAGPEAVIEAAEDSSLVVFGCSGRWRTEGLGLVRVAVASAVDCSVLLVHRGLRPGGLSPRDSLTQFTWSLAGSVVMSSEARVRRARRETAG
jgi:DNA-binding SARP family transcriptional activator